MVDPIPLRGTSLHDRVAGELRALLFRGELRPGQFIDEAALALAWQISRTPLREALKVLAAEGLVELVPGRGSRVVQLNEDDAQALFPVMALLEGRCAFEAVHRAGDEDIHELRRLHETLERHAAQGSVDLYYQVNHVFHQRVQQLAGNRWLNRVTGDLRQFVRLMRGAQLSLPGRMDRSIAEHRALMRAIERRDAEAAQHLMHDHLMAQLKAWVALQQAAAKPAKTTARRKDSRGTS
jgi:DNA-binding GntR family transcriptional regulator